MDIQALELMRSMDEQLERRTYPDDFPDMPDVPAARYFDPAFADAEMTHIWKKSWLMVGLASDLPQAGSYFLVDQLGQSIIVIRGKDDVIRAFHNTCRHRGSALLIEPKGTASRLVCPYHAWCYALDGALVAAPNQHDFAHLDKATHGLAPVQCDSWRGLVYINLDPAAGSLAAFMAPCEKHTAGFPLETLMTADHFFLPVECNWKLALHNFIESYHTPMVHPNSFNTSLEWKSLLASLLPNGHSRLAVRKLERNSIYVRQPLDSDQVADTFRRISIAISVFPNLNFALDPSRFALLSFWPDGPSKSVIEVRLVGWNTTDPQDQARWVEFRETFDGILAEDVALFARMQQSIESRAVPTIIMGYLERALYWFEEEIDRVIGDDNIPKNMRVTPVLQQHVER